MRSCLVAGDKRLSESAIACTRVAAVPGWPETFTFLVREVVAVVDSEEERRGRRRRHTEVLAVEGIVVGDGVAPLGPALAQDERCDGLRPSQI